MDCAHYRKMLEKFHFIDADEKYQTPFPVVVYGSLRRFPECHGNSHLITKFISHGRCFIPDLCPQGITLTHSPGGSGIAEYYEFSPKEFEHAIQICDQIEGFCPQTGGWHFLRTLVEVRILPVNFSTDLFGMASEEPAYKLRNLKITTTRWANYESIPAWVYSNASTNRIAAEKPIWCGFQKSNPEMLY